MTTEKWFPLQHTHSPHGERFRVPWRIAKKAWDVYAALGHGSQSCERLAERTWRSRAISLIVSLESGGGRRKRRKTALLES
jgi:hypothetical protein